MNLYTIKFCDNCTKIKNYLDNKNIKYNNINIESDFKARAKLIMHNHIQLPVLEFDNNLYSGNFEHLIEVINKHYD